MATRAPPPPSAVEPSSNEENGTTEEVPFGYPQVQDSSSSVTSETGPKPTKKKSYSIPDDGSHISMLAVGGFGDFTSRIDPVPEAVITEETAGARLLVLKRKFNELQRKRDSYHGQMAANGGVAAASAMFTAGASLLVLGPAAVHQHRRVHEILAAMRECIEQINGLRNTFGELSTWLTIENSVSLSSEAFKKNQLSKDELVWSRL